MSGHSYMLVKMSELALRMVSPWNYHMGWSQGCQRHQMMKVQAG